MDTLLTRCCWCISVLVAAFACVIFQGQSVKAAYRSSRNYYYSYNSYYSYYRNYYSGYTSGSRVVVSWWAILLIFVGFAAGLAFLIYICKRHQRNQVRVNVRTVQTQPTTTRPMIRLQPTGPIGQYPGHQPYPGNAWNTGMTHGHGYPPSVYPPPPNGHVSTISYPQSPPPAYEATRGFTAPLPPPYPASGYPAASMTMPSATQPNRRPTGNMEGVQPSAPNPNQ